METLSTRFRRVAQAGALASAASCIGLYGCRMGLGPERTREHGNMAPSIPERLRLFVGTYTRGESKGIYVCEFDRTTGVLTVVGHTAHLPNPSFLSCHPNGRFLYSVSETGSFRGSPSGSVAAFSIDRTSGALTFLNQQLSHGKAPCHLTVDATGSAVLVANYSTGSVAVLPILPDGSLGEASCVVQHRGSSVNERRQKGPHAHSINLGPANQYVFAADLGLDKVMIYRLDPETGKLLEADPPSVSIPPGAGPRHFAIHPGKPYAYVINELDSTLTALAYGVGSGSLRPVQTLSTLPAEFAGRNSCADIHVHPSGAFVYGSNRGHDSIAIFAVDPASGRLTPVGHQPTRGKNPRNFAIDPSGDFLLAANQDSGSIVVFRIDRATGRLSPCGSEAALPFPVCIAFAPF